MKLVVIVLAAAAAMVACTNGSVRDSAGTDSVDAAGTSAVDSAMRAAPDTIKAAALDSVVRGGRAMDRPDPARRIVGDSAN